MEGVRDSGTVPERQRPLETSNQGDKKMKLTKNDIKQKRSELVEVLLEIGGLTSGPLRSDVGGAEV